MSPPWRHGSRERTPLPARCEVAVIGGGLAGLGLAAYLSEGGAETALFERRSLGGGLSGRELGCAQTGLVDSPYRLELALGAAEAAEITEFTVQGLELLDGTGSLQRSGGLHVSKDSREEEEVVRSAELRRGMGLGCVLWTAAETGKRLGSEGLGAACHVPAEGVYSPPHAIGALARRAGAAGASLHTGCEVLEVADIGESCIVRTDQGAVLCDAVVFAANAASPGLEPFFGDKITPVRTQAIAIRREGPPLPYACTAQYGYIRWRDAGGMRLAEGCRWATPHMEAGETDDSVVVDAVDRKLQLFAAGTWPGQAGAETLHRWSAITGHSCDGLPIIGPLPGQPDRFACCGFNGRQPGLGLRAAKAVADMLLKGYAEGLPKRFLAQRFL